MIKYFARKEVGWLISGVLIFLIVRSIPVKEFIAALRTVSPIEPLILIAIYLVGFPIRAFRSTFLLPQTTYKMGLAGIFVGYGANNILPARLGEVVRAHVIGKSIGVPRTLVLSSVIVERVFDGVAIVTLLVIGSLGIPLTPTLETVRFMGILIFSVALFGLVVIGFSFRFWQHFIPTNKRRWEVLRSLLEGAELACRSPMVFITILLLSLVIWTIETSMFLYGFHVFDLHAPALGAFFVLGVLNLSVLIPSSPGNLGVFEFVTSSALQVYNVPKGPATAYAVVMHVCQFLPVVLIAWIYLRKLGFKSFMQIREKTAE